MKKLYILLLTVFLTFPFVLNKPVKANSINDDKVDIVIKKDNNTIEIEHTSSIDIEYAVVEYSFYKDSEYISMLDQFKVTNNKFTINKGVSTVAIKVHQVKQLRNNVYYTYMTGNQNTVGSFAGVNRQAIVEIETKAVEVVKIPILSSSKIGSPRLKYYEFYFDFDKEHDELNWIDVNYVVNEYKLWGTIKGDSYNVEERLNHNGHTTLNGWSFEELIPGLGSPTWVSKSESFKVLEENKTSTPGNYVARVSAKTSYLKDSFKIENFAIIRIAYTVDGEFIIDDVVNNPTTPIDDQVNQIMKLLDQLKGMVDGFMNIVNGIVNFFLGNSATAIKVIIGIAVAILLAIFAPFVSMIIKAIVTIVKLLVSLPGKLMNLLKLLFVPKKKKKNNKYERKW